jgi:hypothetical protein
MSKPEIENDFEQFRIERDAAMTHLALNELDPFVECSLATQRTRVERL